MGDFTHFDLQGNAVMADVSGKSVTDGEAVACGRILMSQECFHLVKGGGMKKGDVLGVARVAGIMGAKKASELIPLCQITGLTGAEMKKGLAVSGTTAQNDRDAARRSVEQWLGEVGAVE